MGDCNLNFAHEVELVCQTKKYFVIPVFKDPLSNLIDLFLKICLVLKNKSIKLKVINTVIIDWSFELSFNSKLYSNMF